VTVRGGYRDEGGIVMGSDGAPLLLSTRAPRAMARALRGGVMEAITLFAFAALFILGGVWLSVFAP
jgi:hypothetical protein